MRSNVIPDVLSAVDVAYRDMAALRLETLSRAELYALIAGLDRLDRQRVALDQRLMGRLLAMGGPSARDAARRLRISAGEAQRRFEAAG